MNYAVEMCSSSMVYKPSFLKTESGIQKLSSGVHVQTHRHRDRKAIS
jgi:hypothetical protein